MKYGLIGERLSHSYSKKIHSLISNYEYELLELNREELTRFFVERNFCGINVTIPYKEEVIKYLDFISDKAKEIGAVNTIVNDSGKLCGYNTDYSGFVSLVNKNNIVFSDKKVLILGTGGTSKTIYRAALDMGAKEVVKVSRNKKDCAITYSDAEKNYNDADIIVNTTPVGMFPGNEKVKINLDYFFNLSAVIDVIYNPLRTDFVLYGKEKGITSVGGLYMLVSQAVSSSKLFCNLSTEDDVTDKIYHLLLKLKQNIVLIGMPTCGKTSIGKIISEKSEKNFFDSDEIIIKQEKKEIAKIFSEYGEEFFRKTEKEIIRTLSAKTGSVIAVGGGTILDKENVTNLKKNGVLFFIDRDIEKLMPKNDRPLSQNYDALKKLYSERYNIYKESADFIVNGNGTVEETADKIIEVFENENFDY